MNHHRIFISYRRYGGDVTAKLVSEALKNRGYTTFYDYDALKGGTFDDRIEKEIIDCTDMVLVLPPKGLDRCINENDWIRQEVALALQHEKNIIPVMLDGFEFPSILPEDIDKVRYYNGVRFRMEFFDAVIDRIIEKLSHNKNGEMKVVTDSEPTPVKAQKTTPKHFGKQIQGKTMPIREWLTACSAVFCFVAAILLCLAFFFLSSEDFDLALICILMGNVSIYIGYICFAFKRSGEERKKLRVCLYVSFCFVVLMLIAGFIFARPFLLLCEIPYILFFSLFGGLFLLLRVAPEDSPYIVDRRIRIRKKTFIIAYSSFTVLVSSLLFLLVFTLGFFSDIC